MSYGLSDAGRLWNLRIMTICRHAHVVVPTHHGMQGVDNHAKSSHIASVSELIASNQDATY